ncbi:MAG TPA: GDP-mannose mannosyl hydrolase [Candidatus Acidoferrum sp.]|jgi:colanic acid biosynthesis protein WcaH|nr:GDP-mannose mannosyl hydrolase [Candidatus Acidoferrum sp.]
MGDRAERRTVVEPEPKPGQWLEARDFADVVRLTPLVSMDLLVRAPDGRVLVGRRVNEPAKNCFFLVGGRITKNESRAAAFRRLTVEELGVELNIEHARFLGVYDHFYPTNRFEREGFGTHYVALGYELRLFVEPAALPREQHGEYAWMTETELLESPQVHENTKEYFRTAGTLKRQKFETLKRRKGAEAEDE